MVDDRYWGRGPTGKRNLGDADVRRLLDLNSRRREDFAALLRQQIETGPPSQPGCLHLLVSPRAGRPGSLARLVDACLVQPELHPTDPGEESEDRMRHGEQFPTASPARAAPAHVTRTSALCLCGRLLGAPRC